MFEITYRINTAELDWLKTTSVGEFDEGAGGETEGFMKLEFDKCEYGYCIETEGAEGGDLLTNWFISLLTSIIVLEKKNYVAISDIESYNTWLEFKREGSKLIVSIIKAEKGSGSSFVESTKILNGERGNWYGIAIDIHQFKVEVVEKARQYLDELRRMNSNFVFSVRLKAFEKLILAANNVRFH